MDASLVDPRDATGEVDNPTYRVDIVSQDGNRIDTWRIAQARDVRDVLAWSEERRGDGSAVIHVEVHDARSGGVTLLRLSGAPHGRGHGGGMPAVASG